MISNTTFIADMVGMIADFGVTCTIAEMKSVASMTDSCGEVIEDWKKVTTTLVRLRTPTGYERTSQVGFGHQEMGGVAFEARKIAVSVAGIGLQVGRRVYLGPSVTSTAEHWFVGIVHNLKGHDKAVCDDTGPKEP